LEKYCDVVVVGSYARDVCVLVNRFPEPGETTVGRDLVESDGGKGSNQAVQAARCGAGVAIVAALGRDENASHALDRWRHEGIVVDHVKHYDAVKTGSAFIVSDATGENQIIINPGANAELCASDIRASARVFQSAKVVTAQLETPVETVAEAFRLGKLVGAQTVLNAAPAAQALPDELWSVIDILIVNEGEAATMSGLNGEASADEAADILLKKVGVGVVVTLGSEGALLVTHDGGRIVVPALPSSVVDTTGAGDAFVGAFSCVLAQTCDLQESVRVGVIAGSFACRQRGAVPSYGNKRDFELSIPAQ
jgi:ribokinase